MGSGEPPHLSGYHFERPLEAGGEGGMLELRVGKEDLPPAPLALRGRSRGFLSLRRCKMEMTTFDLGEFQRRLGEAIAWSRWKAPLSDPQHGLRTAELSPPAGLVTPTEQELGDPPQPWTAEASHAYWHRKHLAEPQILQERQAIVDEVASKRRALLNASRFDVSQEVDIHGIGRLLIYYPDQNLFDGAAMNSSEGFFNVDNVPPWDTWLAYVLEDVQGFGTYLLAWVPPQFLELATAGVMVNPEMCILWAEDVDTQVARHLRDVGLLH